MSKMSGRQPIQPPQEPDRQSPQEAYKTLRKLIIGSEQTDFKRVRARVENPRHRTEDISQVLPEAVVLQASRNNRMVPALRPTVEQIIQTSVKRDPKPLVNALFPIIGPAIRKSVAEAFRQMMQSLNNTLEHSASIKGIKWRLQALRTGKPFAEVVLLNTLLYRVEQIFLIHRKTGLLLTHAIADGVTVQDGDMVSGMLTAINDFIRDSFTPQETDALSTVQVGETTVVIEEGPHAYLAGVVRGNPPERLRIEFREALESTHLEFTRELIRFNGDTAPFKAAAPHLEPCLLTQVKPSTRKSSPLIWIILVALLGMSLFWTARWARDQMRWSDYLNRLRSEPGIVVTFAEKRAGKFRVNGLWDPLAANPIALIPKAGLDRNRVVGHWEPFYAMQPKFILTRAKHLSHPPSSMVLVVKDNALVASGSAPLKWMTQNRPILSAIPGISNYDDTQLVALDTDALLLEKARLRLKPPMTVTLDVKNGHLIVTGRAPHQWVLKLENQGDQIPDIRSVNRQKLIDIDKQEMDIIGQKLEQITIGFSNEAILAGPDDIGTLDQVVRLIDQLQTLSAPFKITAHIKILGHTDAAGTQEKNRRLRLARAEKIRSSLIEKGISPSILFVTDMENRKATIQKKSEAIVLTGRRVTFQVILLKPKLSDF